MNKRAKQVYEFGPFRLDATERVLLRDGAPVSLTPKALETLILLVQNCGHIVEKDELMKTVWPDSFVDEGGLTRNISVLRKALGDDSADSRYIETVPKRGYRFSSAVKELWPQRDELVFQRHARLRITTEERSGDDSEQEATRAAGATHARRSRTILLFAVLLAVLSAAVAYKLISNRTPQPGQLSGVRTIAILPFKDLRTEGAEEYLGVALADALITRLGNIGQLRLRPTSAVVKYNSLDQDAIAIGRELGVEVVLEGTIQRSREGVRITAQLVNVNDAAPMWSGKFDERFDDALAIEDSLAESVAQALTKSLSRAQKSSLARRNTDNPEAYQLYMKGRYHWNKRTKEGLQKALLYCQQAIDKDPGYALAYSGMADCYVLFGDSFNDDISPREAYEKTVFAANRALEMDEQLAEAHAALALAKLNHDWAWSQAETEFKRSIELNPSYSMAHLWYGWHLIALGRFDEAIAEMRQAHDLDPLSLTINTDLGYPYYFARRFDEAVERFQSAVEMDANFPQAHFALGRAYQQKGMYAEAFAECRKFMALTGDHPIPVSSLGCLHAFTGNKTESKRILNQLLARSKKEYISPIVFVGMHTALGDKEQAFEWLEKAYEQHCDYLGYLKVAPEYDYLASDPRYAELVRRVGLTP